MEFCRSYEKDRESYRDRDYRDAYRDSYRDDYHKERDGRRW